MNGHTEIAGILDGVSLSSFENEDQRGKALLAAYALAARLETPWETTARLCMSQPALGAALKVCKDLQLFEKWYEGGDKALSSEQLSDLVPCEAALLERLLRHLASNHMLHEPSIGTYEQTPFTKSLLDPVFGEWINHLYDATLPTFFKLPEYLAQTKYKVPLDPENGVFQYAKGWKGDMFNYYAAHPREGESFNHVMGGVMARQAGWLDIFPHDRVVETAVGDGPLVVDVGGNIGHDIERFRQAHPGTAERLYLQDRPEVVKLSKSPDPVNKVAYDFFTPQPVKGARVYYMHGVLHDWSDEPARKILAMQRDALKPGYSTLLIHDHIAPRERAHPHTTAYDLTMMVMVAGTERTEAQWQELLQSEGYKVVKIWTSPLAVQSIIEAELA
ncbi:hypothetical protein DPSP01_011978 [Paraphaeosphaeria sporulosa]|uniref:S-adenosyl-L-methionine-dependent methyltransferase n=1 Tax=Paraphaeosphaeria sporulosa TaxID=1460663 RepID=A0A177CVD6_9PLEO|nr:S-adenosyl-L-methionine-dependent methyltransferase [Paraphaeosphaeria sporulosa]OAG11206.1 S-adenosyl-L-methionine-dependent methyltransferase [Paraphaeosphaeria sporulosa]